MPKLVLRSENFACIYTATNRELSRIKTELKEKLSAILGYELSYNSSVDDKTQEACEKLEKSLHILNAKIRLIKLENEVLSEDMLNTIDDLKYEFSKASSLLQEIQEMYDMIKDLSPLCEILKEKSEQRDKLFEKYDMTPDERREYKANLGSDNHLI